MKNTILLIGGSNIDYIATSNEKLIRHSSNVGTLEISFGGVMRNVVENLQRLGNDCVFLTAIGNDAYGLELKKFMFQLGCSIYYPSTKYPTSCYIALNDNNHDLELGLNDMRIMEDLNEDFILSHRQLVDDYEYIVLDSNLSEECIKILFETFKDKKFIVEGISPTKIVKYQPYLQNIFMLKCNIYEAKAIMNSDFEAKTLALMMMGKGCKCCVISQGKDKVCFGYDNKVGFVDVPDSKEPIKGNTTGCGDALFAGIIDHYLHGKTLREAIEFGIKMSQITLQAVCACNPEISKLKYEHK